MHRMVFQTLGALALFCAGATAQTSQTYGSEGNWSLFEDDTGNEKACWIATQQITETNLELLFMVTKIGNRDFGVTLVARSEYPEESPVYLDMPGLRSYEFTKRLRDAWPRHASDDPKIIDGLASAEAAGENVTFSFGIKVFLDYDVTGFQEALARLKRTCVE